jgi:hypothetical protein
VIPLAHVAGMPVEELLPALASTGASLLTARAWLSLQLRRDRRRESGK